MPYSFRASPRQILVTASQAVTKGTSRQVEGGDTASEGMNLAQANWTRGYRADSEYTFGIYPFLNPDTLLLTLALQGLRPAADIVSTGDEDGRRLVYCELGCGQGLTLNLMAARDPDGSYHGVDYNPNQVRNARSFAAAAGIRNVNFAEESFADLDKYDIPDCDVIVLHGVWSWIDSQMQECIIQFIRRKLKPGGVLFVSYNCAVGRSSDNPMRKLLMAAERGSAAQGRDARVTDAIAVSQKLADAGAQYFQATPTATERLKGLADHEPAYLEQEYLNCAWQNYFHDEVAAAMSEAKLNYVGSANMANNKLEMALPSEAIEFAGRFSAVSDHELLKDIWTNNTFRQDIYVRGVQQISPVEMGKLLENLYFSLARRREDCVMDVQVPGGMAKIPEKPYIAILDALANGVQTGCQIADIIAKSDTQMTLDGVIGALIAVGLITLAPARTAVRRSALSLAGFETATDDLVSANHKTFIGVIPGLGTGVQLSATDYYFWIANRKKIRSKADWALERLTDTGRNIVHDGKVVTDRNVARELLRALEVSFDGGVKPLMALGHKV